MMAEDPTKRPSAEDIVRAVDAMPAKTGIPLVSSSARRLS
jgi:hypothetical protein